MKTPKFGNKLKLYYAGFAFVISSVMTGVPAYSMELEEAVKVAIDTHPTIQAAEAALRASKENVWEARSGFLPSIDFTGDTGYQYANTSTTRGRSTRGSGDPGVSTWRKSAELSMTQSLFDGFATIGNVESAEWQSEVSSYDLVDAREEIALRTVQSFLDVYRNRQVVKMAKSNVDLHMRILDRVETRVQGGQSDQADLNQAKSRLALAKARYRQIQGDQIESESRFLEVVGTPANELKQARPRTDQIPMGLNIAIQVAHSNNPQIKAAKASTKSLDADVGVAEAPFYPTFDLRLSEGHDWDVSGVEGPSTDRQAVITMNYNLFRGGADTARKKRALELASEARMREAETSRAIERQTRIAYNAYETASERLAYLQDRSQASREAVASYWQQYDIGGRTLLDVLDVENELFQSNVAYADGELAFLFTQFRVLAAMGELVDSLTTK